MSIYILLYIILGEEIKNYYSDYFQGKAYMWHRGGVDFLCSVPFEVVFHSSAYIAFIIMFKYVF